MLIIIAEAARKEIFDLHVPSDQWTPGEYAEGTSEDTVGGIFFTILICLVII